MITQRRLLWVTGAVVALLAALGVVYLLAVNTESGRRRALATLLARAQSVFGGRATLTVGSLDRVGFRRIILTNVSVLDTAGVPVVHADRVEGSLDIGGLFDKSIHLRSLDLRGVTLNLKQDFTGPWNIAYIISGTGPKGAPRTMPALGDDIRIDAIRLTALEITTEMPWAPHPIFQGRARDSVIAVRDSLHDIVHTQRGMLQRRRISLERVVARNGIIVQPGGKPSSVLLDTVIGTISDPPVRLVAASGSVTWTPDSLRFDLPRVRLPNSSGAAQGLLAWNTPGPLRYDATLNVTAGFVDLAWIWEVLPTSGGGTMLVHMRTLADANDTEYTLTNIDAKAMDSHVRGAVTIETHPADLLLHDVDLAFEPIGSELLRRLTYGALPNSIRGTFDGHLIARNGGPLNAFTIDRFDARFLDAQAANAVSSIRLSGRVGFGAAPSARDVTVQDLRVDLRSARVLAPSLPVDGSIQGRGIVKTANLQSADLARLDVTWTDGAGNVTTARGDASVNFGAKVPTVLAALQLDPISLRAIARIDSTFPLLATLRGPVTVNGSLDALQWSATLAADAGGRVAMQGSAGLTPSDWKVSAQGTIDGFDARAWVGRSDVPTTALDGQLRFTAAGRRDQQKGATLSVGSATVALRQTASASRVAMDFSGSGTLDVAHLRVDSAFAHVGGIALDAHGLLARTASTTGDAPTDTMVVSARTDSLALVRAALPRLASMIAPMDSAMAKTMRSYAADTLQGDVTLSGYLFGGLNDFGATFALSAQSVQVGAVRVGRVFGSAQAAHVRSAPTFEGAATVDEIRGIGAVRISTANFRVMQATPDSGRLFVDVRSEDTARLELRGAYARAKGTLDVLVDSVRFGYDINSWRNNAPIHLRSDATGLRLDSIALRSNARGLFSLSADVPNQGAVRIDAVLDRFPIGEAMAFAVGTPAFSSALSGDVHVTGTRDAPLLNFQLRADSVGQNGTFLPPLRASGSYADRRLVARAELADTTHGTLRADVRLPIDLSLRAVDQRLLSEIVDAEIVADSLSLDSLPLSTMGVDGVRGVLNGRLALTGTMERPIATGTMTLDRFSANIAALGISPTEGRVVVRAVQDSLILESLRVRSGGPSDTVMARGAMRFASGQPVTMRLTASANNLSVARQRDGTDLNIGGNIQLVGPLKRPVLTGALSIPSATLFINPLAASTALDLTTDAVRELLGLEEVPVAASGAQSLARLGSFLTVDNARIELGNDVWVRTPEAKVKVTGGLTVTTNGNLLALEGEITANRGQYRLDLGPVNRGFTVDSGKVRFFGSADISPSLDISATNVVRRANGEEIPVHVHIGGTLDRPLVALTSSDPLYARAPESEIISLLIFGEPTFALDGPRQSTVRAVTGVLLPSLGGKVEGVLQSLLPGLSTVQVVAGGGQTREDLSVGSLLDNVSVSAGKQFGDRTYLRVNTGVCRGAQLWAAVAVEYRLTRDLTAQIGVDPGAAPCSRLGSDALAPRQFGFDLFRNWIF